MVPDVESSKNFFGTALDSNVSFLQMNQSVVGRVGRTPCWGIKPTP